VRAENLIIINGSDSDGRFIAMRDPNQQQRIGAREAAGQPWFYQDNLEYPETASAAQIRADWVRVSAMNQLARIVAASWGR
jgi:hypothetical protein